MLKPCKVEEVNMSIEQPILVPSFVFDVPDETCVLTAIDMSLEEYLRLNEEEFVASSGVADQSDECGAPALWNAIVNDVM